MSTKARMLAVGVIVPLLIAAAAVVAMLVALPQLPDPVAVHWGVTGEPDRFGSPLGFLLLVPVGVLAYSVFAFVVARGDGPETVNRRIILAIAPFFASVLGVMGAGGLLLQRGLADAHQASSILPVVLAGFGAGIALAVVAWFVLPAADPVPAVDPAEVPTLELAEGERAAWFQRAEPSRALSIGLAVVGAVVIAGGGAAMWFVAPLGVAILTVVFLLVLAVVVAGSLFWTVRVDARGLLARSVLGFPRLGVPIAEVATATSITVDPARDFGGWGVRWGGRGRIGLVLRAGEALEVRRTDGRSLVVTVAHSERAAALLNSLARRA